jgi:hypothetical protein
LGRTVLNIANMVNKMKKEWNKPKLIVVMRGSREENVLAVCKSDNSSGPDSYNISCMLGLETGCENCNATMPS